MAEMLLLNPRKRRARKANPKRRRARRHNPVSVVARRRNPLSIRRVARRIMRRRRNPISLSGTARSAIAMLKDAAIGGAGALAVDVGMGYVNNWLPASLQRVPGQPGIGDLVKMVLTIAAGRALSRPTRGMSVKMAQGALTVQAHGLMAGLLPGSVTLGYTVPGQVMQGQARVGRPSLQRYVAPGVTPLLNRYVQPGVTPLLNGSRNAAMAREGYSIR